MDHVVKPGEKIDYLSFTADGANDLLSRKLPVIVTGASGWLGRAVLEMCESALGQSFASSVFAFTSAAATIALRSGNQIRTEPLHHLQDKRISGALIFHCAFLTREHTEIGYETYVRKNREITATVAAFIANRGCSGLFLPSSGAVYRPDRSIETDLAANPYAVLKLEDEQIFGQIAGAKNFPIAVMRIFNLSGPFINKLSSYALASIIEDAMRRGAITLRAAFPVIRSYAYVRDVVRIGMQILQHNADVGPVDTAGEMDIEVGVLAARVLSIMDQPDMPIHRPSFATADENRYVGDGARYVLLAQQFGMRLLTLDEQIQSTIDYLKSAAPSVP